MGVSQTEGDFQELDLCLANRSKESRNVVQRTQVVVLTSRVSRRMVAEQQRQEGDHELLF